MGGLISDRNTKQRVISSAGSLWMGAQVFRKVLAEHNTDSMDAISSSQARRKLRTVFVASAGETERRDWVRCCNVLSHHAAELMKVRKTKQ